MSHLKTKIASMVLMLISGIGLIRCTPPPIQTQSSFNIMIHENRFTPDTLYVNTSSEVILNITNETSESHDWIILTEPYFSPYHKGEVESYYKVTVPAGETIKTTFIAPATAIQLDIVCENENCVLAGMRARLIVVQK